MVVVEWMRWWWVGADVCLRAMTLVCVEQGYCSLPAGVRMSSSGRTAAYEQALAWKVMDDREAVECIAFVFINWSFVS